MSESEAAGLWPGRGMGARPHGDRGKNEIRRLEALQAIKNASDDLGYPSGLKSASAGRKSRAQGIALLAVAAPARGGVRGMGGI